MVGLSEVFLVLILAFDFAVSLWNAYASGLTWTLLRNEPGQRFAKAAAVAGLGLAFAGMAYAVLVILAYVAWFLGVLTIGDVLFVLAFDFLVFGAMIIGFGLVVTAQSVAIAYRQRNFGAIAISAWNVIAEVWDLAIYAEGFQAAAGTVRDGERTRFNLYAVIAVALGIAFLLTYVAYRHGARRAEAAIESSPGQSAHEAQASASAAPNRSRRMFLTVAIAIVVAVVLLLAAVAYVASTHPPPKVHVVAIHVGAPSDVCGLNANPIGYGGFDDAPASQDAFSLAVHDFNGTSCTIRGVTTNTSGFSLNDVVVPLILGAGQDGWLNLTLTLPDAEYSGNLDLIYV